MPYRLPSVIYGETRADVVDIEIYSRLLVICHSCTLGRR